LSGETGERGKTVLGPLFQENEGRGRTEIISSGKWGVQRITVGRKDLEGIEKLISWDYGGRTGGGGGERPLSFI